MALALSPFQARLNLGNVGAASPLTHTVWKEELHANANTYSNSNPNSSPTIITIEDASARLTWNDLTVTTTNAKGGSQVILDHLNGFAEPGGLVAIMGPSGSGKSTLLDSLAGRLAKNAQIRGDIRVNGRKQRLSYGMAAYVSQDDVLIGTLSVREIITYSANLRLPDKMPAIEKHAVIEKAIAEMGLKDSANTVVGNWHTRGLSGGEKRRLSIAIEILTRPRLLFLDEPTSGLDSASAFFVSCTLRNLAKDGRTVVASIHQPSSEVFSLFTSLYLLSHGRTMYFGPASEAQQFFTAAGFPCLPQRNPSDHFLQVINSDFDAVKENLKHLTYPQDPCLSDVFAESVTAAEAVSILSDTYRNSIHANAAIHRIDQINETKGLVLDSSGSRASFWMQTFTLTQRSFVNMFRDLGYYWLRLVIYLLLTICVGSIYFRVGTAYTAIMARAACMSFISGFLTFMSIGGFPSFVEDMKVFMRERLNGHYGVAAFVLANSLSSLPFLLLISISCGAISYNMIQLHPGWDRFTYFVLSLFASLAAVEGLMMTVASIVPNFLMGIITGSGILGIYLLLAGYLRLPNDLPKPVWRYPLSYMGYDMFAYQGCLENDFMGLEFDSPSPFLPKLSGEFILREVMQIESRRSKWLNLGIIFFMAIVYRLIFFFVVKFSEKLRPLIRVLTSKYRTQCVERSNYGTHNTIRPE